MSRELRSPPAHNHQKPILNCVQVEFFQGWADDVNFNEKRVLIEDATVRRPLQLSGKAFRKSLVSPTTFRQFVYLASRVLPRYVLRVVAQNCLNSEFYPFRQY